MMQFSNYGCPQNPTPELPVMTGLWAWHDAADTATITLEGADRIIQWADKSGNGRHLVRASGTPGRPYYGGRDMNEIEVVEFRGAEAMNWDYAYGNIGSGDNTVVMAVQNDADDSVNPNNNGWLFHDRDDNSANQSWGLMLIEQIPYASGEVNVSSYSHETYGTGGAHLSASGVSVPLHAAHVAGSRRQGSVQQAMLNGVLANAAPAIDVNNGAAMWLCARYSAGALTSCFDGVVAEVLLYNRALSPAEIEEVTAYLQAKWAMT